MSDKPGNVNKLTIVKPYEEFPKLMEDKTIVNSAEEEAAWHAAQEALATAIPLEANTEHAAEVNEAAAETAATEETASELPAVEEAIVEQPVVEDVAEATEDAPDTESRSRRKKKN